MILSISCWGDYHTELFYRRVLPSLRPNLLPEDRIFLHTIPQPGLTPYEVQNLNWRNDIALARELGERILLLWPDNIWGENSFDFFRGAFANGASAIFMHCPRTKDAIWPTRHDHRALARHALTHEHHLSWAYRADSICFPKHAELVNWAVLGEGLLTVQLGACPVALDPARHTLNSCMFLEQPGRLVAVTDSDQAICLSLAPPGKDLDWLKPATLSKDRIRAWLQVHTSPVNFWLRGQAYHLHYRDLTVADWLPAHMEHAAFLEGLTCRS